MAAVAPLGYCEPSTFATFLSQFFELAFDRVAVVFERLILFIMPAVGLLVGPHVLKAQLVVEVRGPLLLEPLHALFVFLYFAQASRGVHSAQVVARLFRVCGSLFVLAAAHPDGMLAHRGVVSRLLLPGSRSRRLTLGSASQTQRQQELMWRCLRAARDTSPQLEVAASQNSCRHLEREAQEPRCAKGRRAAASRRGSGEAEGRRREGRDALGGVRGVVSEKSRRRR